MRILWIVQDGVLAGPGASQTLPYLRGLASRGFRPSLLSVEKERHLFDAGRVRAVRRDLEEAGVRWEVVPYGRGPAPVRTALQTLRVLARARGLVRRDRIDLVHARSHLPALVASALPRPFLFDMRGFWPRERVDGGVWPEGGLLFAVASRMERFLLGRAAGVVVLAEAARPLLPPLDVPVRVIPTAVDLARFRPGLPRPEGAAALEGRRVYVLAGAMGTWYRLEDALDLLALAVRRDERVAVLVLTEEDPRPAVAGLLARGVPGDRITARGVPPAEVPFWFSLADAGIVLVESAPSKRASAPTKLGEFLACGVPVVITPGIGDSEEILAGGEAGVVLRESGPAGRRRALAELDALLSHRGECARRCRRTAEERLSLEKAVAAWAASYREIGETVPCD